MTIAMVCLSFNAAHLGSAAGLVWSPQIVYVNVVICASVQVVKMSIDLEYTSRGY